MSLSHPNLLQTFKTCVVRLLPEPSGQPSPDLDARMSSVRTAELSSLSAGASGSVSRPSGAGRVVRSIVDRNALVEVMPLTAVLEPGEYETWAL